VKENEMATFPRPRLWSAGATLSFVALSLAGCAKRVVITAPDRTSTREVGPVKKETMGTEDEIIVEGRNRGSVRLLAVKQARLNGFLQLQIGFRNVSNSDADALFEVHFFDSDGYPIPETSGWLPISIVRRGVQYASVTCVKREAQTFKIHMLYK